MSQVDEHDTQPASTNPAVDDGIVEPPSDFLGIMKRLGPGLIIAGSIVGSGELIATTKTGAQAGISLLWLIIIGCLIKVFVQIELGRYAISHGETTLTALDRVPGPTARVDLWSNGPRMSGNWIMWLWFIMACCTVAQLGAIVGGVGQALAITFPMSGDYQEAIVVPSESEFKRYIKWEDDITKNDSRQLEQLTAERRKRVLRGHEILREKIEGLGSQGDLILGMMRDGKQGADLVDPGSAEPVHLIEPSTSDDKYWAAVVAIFTSGLLFWGRYGLIQNVSLVLVVSFTFITIGNVIALQSTEEFAIPMADFIKGLSFGAPEQIGDKNPWVTAIATFGIIGVGASELIAYPYWCLEKGYAKFAGKRSSDENWARRARGWMKVMHYDAFASMIVYTIATIAFYVMGVAVLFNEGSDPDGMRMVSTLATAYVPVFGEYAKWLFLIGAIAVLYSTFMVANAGNARMIADAIKVFGFIPKDDEEARRRGVVILSAGTMQAFMLPVVGLGAIYFRYKLTDQRLRPSFLWDICLIVSFLGLLLAGGYGIISRLI
jgi:Mn2+/Fe2+ NRAMP family transporter